MLTSIYIVHMSLGTCVNRLHSYTHLHKHGLAQVRVMAATRHPNVLMLLGVCLEWPCLVTELCSKGPLADILAKARSEPGRVTSMNWMQRLKMAWEIAKVHVAYTVAYTFPCSVDVHSSASSSMFVTRNLCPIEITVSVSHILDYTVTLLK